MSFVTIKNQDCNTLLTCTNTLYYTSRTFCWEIQEEWNRKLNEMRSLVISMLEFIHFLIIISSVNCD